MLTSACKFRASPHIINLKRRRTPRKTGTVQVSVKYLWTAACLSCIAFSETGGSLSCHTLFFEQFLPRKTRKDAKEKDYQTKPISHIR
jgi:hypothetical protein